MLWLSDWLRSDGIDVEELMLDEDNSGDVTGMQMSRVWVRGSGRGDESEQFGATGPLMPG